MQQVAARLRLQIQCLVSIGLQRCEDSAGVELRYINEIFVIISAVRQFVVDSVMVFIYKLLYYFRCARSCRTQIKLISSKVTVVRKVSCIDGRRKGEDSLNQSVVQVIL